MGAMGKLSNSKSKVSPYILLYYLASNTVNGVVYISYKRLSKELGISSRTISKYLRQLQNEGYLTRLKKGYYRINPIPIPFVSNNISPLPHKLSDSSPKSKLSKEDNLPQSKLSVNQHSIGKDVAINNTNVVINNEVRDRSIYPTILSLMLYTFTPEVLRKFIREVVKEYRLHNVIVSLPSQDPKLSRIYKIPESFGNMKMVSSVYPNKIVINIKDSINYSPDHDIADIIYDILRLPYRIASYLSNVLLIDFSYDLISIDYFELAIMFTDKVPEEIVNGLANTFLKFIDKSTLELDYSLDKPELEFKGKDLKTLLQVLIMAQPLALLEFLKYDIELDKLTYQNTEEIKRLLKKLLKEIKKSKLKDSQ